MVLQVAPGVGRRFYYRCRDDGVGEGEEGETKPPEMGSHSYSGAVAVAVRCRSELPGSLPSSSPPMAAATFPLGKWGVITKTLGQASLFATDVYRAVP